MGYLDNSSVIVDAILTKKGRELLSRQDGSFNITQFALADDEIDYSLYNENHPDGSAYYGEAIENLPLIEAIPNENNTMVSKLVTLPRGTTKIPVLSLQSTNITVGKSANFTITPNTLNFDTTTESNYSFTIADRRLIQQGSSTGGTGTGTAINIPFTGTALSQTFIGTSFTGTSLAGTTLFGSNSALATSIIIIGLDTGARATVTLQVNKDGGSGNNSSAPASSF
mgnify:CR=1 FL=1|tara:strand:+ start:386 stop:1063 length:678 start_codon:yes stop_codon:yes gene_type:complete